MALLREGVTSRVTALAAGHAARMTDAVLGIAPETELERRIVADPEWVEGASWGAEMHGHPEARVADHIAEVLGNVDRFGFDGDLRAPAAPDRPDPRHLQARRPVVAARPDRPRQARAPVHRTARRRRGRAARGRAPRRGLPDLAAGARRGRWEAGEARIAELAGRLGEHLGLFRAFYRCDNATGSKSPDDREWFEDVLARRGLA